MKHFEILALVVAVAFCHSAFAADKPSPAMAKAGNVRVQEKAVTARHMRGLMQGAPSTVPTLLLRVETRMENGKQMITATATAHTGGQTGPLTTTDTLDVRVSQPAQFRRETQQTNTAMASGSVDASGGKFKTVVADASMKVSGSEMARVTVSVPGDSR